MTQSSSQLVHPLSTDYSFSSCPFPSTEPACPPSHNNTQHQPTPRTSHKGHHDTASHTHALYTPAALHASSRNSTHTHNPCPHTSSAPPHYHKNTLSLGPSYHKVYMVQHDRSGRKDAGTSCFYRKFARMNVAGVLGLLSDSLPLHTSTCSPLACRPSADYILDISIVFLVAARLLALLRDFVV